MRTCVQTTIGTCGQWSSRQRCFHGNGDISNRSGSEGKKKTCLKPFLSRKKARLLYFGRFANKCLPIRFFSLFQSGCVYLCFHSDSLIDRGRGKHAEKRYTANVHSNERKKVLYALSCRFSQEKERYTRCQVINPGFQASLLTTAWNFHR